MTHSGPMDAEFDTVAEWTAEVAESLGPQYRIPAAYRGSGRPSELDWLLAGLAPQPGDVMIDIGAGLGGPAAYPAERTGGQPVLRKTVLSLRVGADRNHDGRARALGADHDAFHFSFFR